MLTEAITERGENISTIRSFTYESAEVPRSHISAIVELAKKCTHLTTLNLSCLSSGFDLSLCQAIASILESKNCMLRESCFLRSKIGEVELKRSVHAVLARLKRWGGSRVESFSPVSSCKMERVSISSLSSRYRSGLGSRVAPCRFDAIDRILQLEVCRRHVASRRTLLHSTAPPPPKDTLERDGQKDTLHDTPEGHSRRTPPKDTLETALLHAVVHDTRHARKDTLET